MRIDLIRNARYHDDREAHFARIQRSVMFVVVATGSVSFAAAIGQSLNAWAAGVAAVTTAAGLLDLVYDISGRARVHANLKRLSYSLLSELECGGECRNLRGRLVSSYGDEPVAIGTVGAVAYNAAMMSEGRSPHDLLKISPMRRLFRHWWRDDTDLRTYRELDEEPPRSLTAR